MLITNIVWNINTNLIFYVFDYFTCERAAKLLSISKEAYANMDSSERTDLIYNIYHNDPAAKASVMNLPDEINIPDNIDTDKIADYIANEYEFCVDSYTIATK